MKLVSERLLWAMEEKSKRDGVVVTPADVARAAKVSDSSASYWLKGENGISAAKARLVGDYLGVDPLWLETGAGGNPSKTGRQDSVRLVEQTPSEYHSQQAMQDLVEIVNAFNAASPSDRTMLLKAARTAAKRAAADSSKTATDKR